MTTAVKQKFDEIISLTLQFYPKHELHLRAWHAVELKALLDSLDQYCYLPAAKLLADNNY